MTENITLGGGSGSTMFPNQIVTGAANPNPNTFACTHFNDDTYFAYSSSRNVYVLKGGSLRVIQVLTGHKTDVTSIAWLNYHSKLLTASSTEIFVYDIVKNPQQPVQPSSSSSSETNKDNKLEWERIMVIPNPFEINTMCWLNSNSFVVGGEYLALWKLDFDQIHKQYALTKQQMQKEQDNPQSAAAASLGLHTSSTAMLGSASSYQISNKANIERMGLREQKIFRKQATIVWRSECSQPVHHISCSPDGSLFATAGKCDRMLKVWYKQPKVAQTPDQDDSNASTTSTTSAATSTKTKGYFKDHFNQLTSKEPKFKFTTQKQQEKDDEFNQNLAKQQQQQKLRAQQKQKRFEYESYGFIYLPHPRAISWISWRMRDSSHHNILLTNCKDGVVRLWQQSLQSNRLQFNVSNIIHAGTESVDWINCYSPLFLQQHHIYQQQQQQQSGSSSSSSSQPQSSTSSQPSTSSKQTTTATTTDGLEIRPDLLTNLKNPILLRLKEGHLTRSKSIVDWILGVKQDGTLIMWKLKTDDSTSRQTSSISIWINSPQILSPQEVGPNRIIALYQPLSISDNTPTSITICVNSFNGAISCRKFYIQNQNQTQISNTSPPSRCYGHKSSIRSINVSPASHYLSTVDRQNNIILWQTTDGTKIQAPYYLVDIGSIGTSHSITWSSENNFCFSANKDGILVYHIDPHDNNKPLKLPIGIIDQSCIQNSDHEEFYEEIHVVDCQPQLYRGISGKKNAPNFSFFIIGINNYGDKLTIWGVTVDYNQNGPQTTVSTSSTTSNSPFSLSSKLLATKTFSSEQKITCICPTPKGVADKMSTIQLFKQQENQNENENEKENGHDDDNSSSTSTIEEYEDIPSHPICVTGSMDGIITVWSLSAFDTPQADNQSATGDDVYDELFKEKEDHEKSEVKNQDNDDNDDKDHHQGPYWKITELCHHAAYQQPVESVSPAYFGRFASTPSMSAFHNYVINPVIHIWELESHTPKLQLEDTIKFYSDEEFEQQQQLVSLNIPTFASEANFSYQQSYDPFEHQSSNSNFSIKSGCNFSFATFADGTVSLATGFKNTIRVLRKPIDRSIGSYNRSWMETHRYNDLSSQCVSIVWGKDRELFVASGNQILVFSKWMKPTEAFLSMYEGIYPSIDTVYHQHSILSRPLPYYHPKLLTEYMMAGKFEKVENILMFISRFLISRFPFLLTDPNPVQQQSIYDDDDSDEEKDYHQQPKPSSSSSTSAADQVDLSKPVFIPTVDIEDMLLDESDRPITDDNGMDHETNNGFKDKRQEEEQEELVLDKYNNNLSTSNDDLFNHANQDEKSFTKKQAAKLNEILSNVRLAGLNSAEQIQLLALTDTYGQIGEMRGGLDENGQRFLLNVKIYQFLKRSMNPTERPISLSAVDILWALHSECQETLLQNCFPTDPLWEDYRQLGAGLWIKNPITLKNTFEKLAKTTYTANKDPSESALYYIALGKKGALVALHRAHKETKQVDFLLQDFTQQKWINLAAKSAYLLQSKHRYDLAASMFLLAGDLKQATNLILQSKGDFQLAYAISRLYEGENGPTSRMILEEHVIPHAKKTYDRSLLSVCQWLLKNYEDSLKILLPSTEINEASKKLDYDQVQHLSAYNSPTNTSGNNSPLPTMGGGFGRIPSVISLSNYAMSSSPLLSRNQQTQKSTTTNSIASQLRTSEMGPSALYFFRYLRAHILLKQLPDDKKQDYPFLRSSIYSYLYSGCSHLALEHIKEIEASHPLIILPNKEIEEEEEEEEVKVVEEEKKPSSSSYDDLGLDFGGSSSYFNSSSKNSGLDDLDFGGSSSYFNAPKSSGLDDLDFGGGASSTTTSNNNSNYFDMGLDFGTTTTKKIDDLGLDFGDTQSSTKNDLRLTSEIKNDGKEFKDDTKKKNTLEREKVSIYPIVDLELKAKLVLQVLVNNLVNFKESNQWNENVERFDEMLYLMTDKYELEKNIIIDRLIVFCAHRQYYKQIIHLYNLLGASKNSANDFMDQACHSILKSIYRIDDYPQTKQQTQHLLKLSIELYSCIPDLKNPSLIVMSIYMILFLASWGNSRFDILLSILYQETPAAAPPQQPKKNTFNNLQFNPVVSNQPPPIGSNVDVLLKAIQQLYKSGEGSTFVTYQDEQLQSHLDSDEEDNDEDKLLKYQKNIDTINCIQKIFELFCLTRFRKVYDAVIKDLTYHHVFDLMHQRLHFWLVSIQSKILSPPRSIYDTFYRKPRAQASTNLLDLVKTFPVFHTQQRVELWQHFIKENDNIDLLTNTILPSEDSTYMPSSSRKIKFAEEAIELYKDGDLLQSFCVDASPPEGTDIQVVAVATTRGIREIDLKHSPQQQSQHHHQDNQSSSDDFDIDSAVATSGEFLSPTQSGRKLRISAKSVSSLNFKGGKQNVFKSAISSLNASKQVDHNIIVQCLESHPSSSYYLSGGIDGSVCLWQFGIPEALAAYQLPTRPRVVRCRFNQSGSKFGACDMSGNLMLWQFAAQEDTLRPFYSLQAHSKQTLDFTFINSGSLLATAGISTNSKKDVCLWDVLLPPHKSLVASYTDQESGASSISYSPKHQLLVVGGKKGSISYYDIRTNKLLDNFKGHTLNTKTLAIDPSEDFVATGSSDGNIKTWSLPSMNCISTFEDSHRKQTFVRPTGVFKSPVSTYGVIQVRMANNHIYSCGADGRLTKHEREFDHGAIDNQIIREDSHENFLLP
ncbi:WD-40 repeat-containing protein [Cavenderia fasciculata]|uniref:WD-40 repeat-containing protein n=1 Tax=Cavenderia fasciculata TaxID=261658 RepID=F4Q0Q9_CACFS|nr:WD-40 repeat-containing protein [Cavenderia fasciculata]EGG18410.1 WD-40 repeat-containing protein [Cavenderia fasciculata]|eukprot:XP_004366314.1 WD-40 repeat-containing protein [Cavenderia fasciculata]